MLVVVVGPTNRWWVGGWVFWAIVKHDQGWIRLCNYLAYTCTQPSQVKWAVPMSTTTLTHSHVDIKKATNIFKLFGQNKSCKTISCSS